MAKKDLLRIPILNAFKERDACPLCLLWSKDEMDYLLYVESNEMTASGGFRKKLVDAMGFCNHHMHLLYEVAFSSKAEDGLAYATYVRDVIGELEAVLRETESGFGAETGRAGGRGFASSGRASRGIQGASATLARAIAGNEICPACSHLLDSERQRVGTFLVMLDDDADFAAVFARSRGVCALHLAAVMESLAQTGSRNDAAPALIMKVELENLGRIRHLLDERIRKYSWEFRDAPITREEANSQELAMNFIGGVEGLHCKTRKTPQYADLKQ